MPKKQNKIHFSLYKHTIVDQDGRIIFRYLIVLMDEDGLIIRWTDFHRYLAISQKKMASKVTTNWKTRCQDAVRFLNWLFFDRKLIASLDQLTVIIAAQYLNDYGLCRLPGDDEYTRRNENTVKKTISNIMFFMERLAKENPCMQFTKDDLYKVERKFSITKQRTVKTVIPTFQVVYRNTYTPPLLRDMPNNAFRILLNVVSEKHTDILMNVAAGAFAGVRPGEACNIRRIDSPLGPGIRFDMIDGDVEDIYIDLTRELNLRSDNLSVGCIKKERMQRVYPVFIKVFLECYERYTKYSAYRKYEKEYGPMTLNSRGKAMTYDTYKDRFDAAVKDAIPFMLDSADPEVVHYGRKLMTENISPHILRHWFSYQLVLNDVDVNDLAYWRGDTSIEAAIPYINNKSEIQKKVRKVQEELTDFMIWRGEELNGKTD